MNINSLSSIVGGLAVFIFILQRQVQARPVKTDSAMKLILVLGGVGLVQLSEVTYAKGYRMGTFTIILIASSLAIAGVLGVMRALSVKVWRNANGVALIQGTALTIVLWIISLAIHFAFEAAIDHSTNIPGGLGGVTTLLYLAVSLGVQREVARFRASRVPKGVNHGVLYDSGY